MYAPKHQVKFLVGVNLAGNKPVSDSDSSDKVVLGCPISVLDPEVSLSLVQWDFPLSFHTTLLFSGIMSSMKTHQSTFN